MQMKGIRRLGSLLGFAILATLVVWRDSMGVLLAGLFYLLIADILCISCVSLATISRGQGRATLAENDLSPIRTRAYVLLLIAGQVAILGILNVAAVNSPRLHVPLILSYLLCAAYFVASYKILSIADSPKQSGGYIPLTLLGVLRSRRFFFIVFVGYCTVCPLTIASLEFSVGSGGWQPSVFQPPQACLLMAAIASAISAGLLFQRYRGVAARNSIGTKVLGVTLCVLAFAAFIQTRFSYGMYVYTISAIALIGGATAVFCLWQIGENAQGGSRPSHEGSVSVESPLHP